MIDARDPAIKARRTEMRQAGHAWGSRLAEIAVAEIATRQAALREIGADAEDLAAWAEACIISRPIVAAASPFEHRTEALARESVPREGLAFVAERN